jgi:carbohydrate kinase (thermoresistant glucokinase family)
MNMTDWRIVVMGVSGCGKSSVGLALADALGASFVDGDDLHPEGNKKLMAAGIPLNDENRWPWLDLVAQALAGGPADIRENTETGTAGATGTVIACSALKRSYRERILKGAPNTFLIHLAGTRELLAERMSSRGTHFMPLSLLDSQLATLEPLASDEPGATFDIALPPQTIVEQAIVALEKNKRLEF